MIGKNDLPVGLAVELIDEAARRRHIRLHWDLRAGTKDIDQLLAAGEVDIWPLVSATPERLKRLHLTTPWIENSYFLVSRRTVPLVRLDQAAGKKVVHSAGAAAAELSKQFLSASNRVPIQGVSELLGIVCRGQADAAFMEARSLENMLLDLPPDCIGSALTVLAVPNAVLRSGLGARKEFHAEADALAEEIISVADDGTFARKVDKWASFSATETRSLIALQKSHQRNALFRRRAYIVSVSCLSSGIIGFLIYRARKELLRSRSMRTHRDELETEVMSTGSKDSTVVAAKLDLSDTASLCARIRRDVALRLNAAVRMS